VSTGRTIRCPRAGIPAGHIAGKAAERPAAAPCGGRPGIAQRRGFGPGYLPAVARRLHHGRDLGEPFDFLTWFEFPPEHATAFEELVWRLRETEEWTYAEREIDLRLAR
jgi:hypothetical protein